jgi:hypothetical protein
MAESILQAIGVPLLLIVSLVFLVFVAWASNRVRDQANAERNRPVASLSEDEQESSPLDQSSNISTVKK